MPDDIQLIYAYFPPTTVFTAALHLRAEAQIQQRAHQLWLAGGGCPDNAWADWFRAEREVVQALDEPSRSGKLEQLKPAQTRL